jgi:hypothetical protein
MSPIWGGIEVILLLSRVSEASLVSPPIPAGIVSSWLKDSLSSTSLERWMIDSGRLLRQFLDRSRRVRLRKYPISMGMLSSSLQQLFVGSCNEATAYSIWCGFPRGGGEGMR